MAIRWTIVGWFSCSEVVERRRVRFLERGGDEPAEEPDRVVRVVRRAQCHPVGLCLHVPADRVLQREREQLEDDEHEEREGNRLRLSHPTAPPRRAREQVRPREGEERVPADVLPDVVAREVAELVREDHLQLARGEAAVEECVEQHDAPARPDADRLRVRERGDVVDRLDDHGYVPDTLLRLELRCDGDELRVGEPVRAEQVRVDEREEQRKRDEHRRREEPPPCPESARKPHDDGECEAQEDELGSEREPVPEQERHVAHLRQAVPALPPQVDDGER